MSESADGGNKANPTETQDNTTSGPEIQQKNDSQNDEVQKNEKVEEPQNEPSSEIHEIKDNLALNPQNIFQTPNKNKEYQTVATADTHTSDQTDELSVPNRPNPMRRYSLSTSPRITALKDEWASKRRFEGNGLPLIACLRCNNHFFVEKSESHFTATARQKNLKYAFTLIPVNDPIQTDIYQLIHIESASYVSIKQIGDNWTLYPISHDDTEFTISDNQDLYFKIVKISDAKDLNLKVNIRWNNKLLTIKDMVTPNMDSSQSSLAHLDGTDKILVFEESYTDEMEAQTQIFTLERVTDDNESNDDLNIIFLLDLVIEPRQKKIGYDLTKLAKYRFIPTPLNELIQQIYVRIDMNRTGYAPYTQVWSQFVQYSQGMVPRIVISAFEDGVKDNNVTHKLIHIRDMVRCLDTIIEFYANEIKMERLENEKEKALKELDPIEIKLRRLDSDLLHQHPFLKKWQNMSAFRRKLYDWKIYIFDKWNSGAENDAGFFLWRTHLVAIQSNFGESIFAFFQFTRWLMILNSIMALLYGIVIFTHCLYFDFLSFDIAAYIDMILGNEFTHSWWFYGAYNAEYPGSIINYNVSFMWIVVSVCSAVVSVVAVLRVLLNAGVQTDDEYVFAKNVFANYSHSLKHKDAVTLQKNSLMIRLHETLLQRLDDEGSKMSCVLLLKRLIGIILCVVIGGLSGIGIVLLISLETTVIIPYVHHNYPQIESIAPYIVPAGVSVIKGMSPHVVRAIVLFEDYSASYKFQQIFFRVFILRIFAILVTLFQTAQTAESTENDEGAACAESQIGMVLYKFILFDMIIEIMFYFVLPGVKYCCGICCGSIQKLTTEQELEELNRKSVLNLLPKKDGNQPKKIEDKKKTEFELAGDSWKAEFDIPGALVDVMYRQGIVWSGMYFSPMIPVMAVVASTATFFIKKKYLFNYCGRPKKALGVTRQLKFFYGMMLLAIITSFVPFNYFLNRTPSCGPHQNKDVLNETQSTLDQDMPSFLQIFFSYAFNGLLLLPLFILTLVYLFYIRGVRNVHETNSRTLKERLLKEKDEKKQILKDYNIRL